MRFNFIDLLFVVVPPVTWFIIGLLSAINEYVSDKLPAHWAKTTGKLIQIKSEVHTLSDPLDSPWWVVKSYFIYEYLANNQLYREALDSTISLGQAEPPTDAQVKAVSESMEKSCPSWRNEIRFWYDPSFPTKLMAHSNTSNTAKPSTEFWHRLQINIFYTVLLVIVMLLIVITDKLGCSTSS